MTRVSDDLRLRLEHLELDGNQIANVLAIIDGEKEAATQSLRQQLAALRDKWREQASKLTSGRIESAGFSELCYAATAKDKAADELDAILGDKP